VKQTSGDRPGAAIGMVQRFFGSNARFARIAIVRESKLAAIGFSFRSRVSEL
jgi:hypothetical protein